MLQEVVGFPSFSYDICNPARKEVAELSNEVYNPDFIEVGDLIRKCRENACMTQADLSEKAGFGEKTLSRLEMGKSNMRIDTFFTLADALGVTPNDIAPSRLTSKKKDRRFTDLETKFNHLNEKQKQLVYDTMAHLMNGLENLN